MQSWTLRAATAAALLLFTIDGHATPTDDVLRFEADLAHAYASADVSFLDRVMLPDFTQTDPRGTVTSKQQELAEVRDSIANYESLQQRDLQVRFYGADTAIVTGRTTIKFTLKGKAIEAEVAFTDTLVRKDGQWRTAASHTSRAGA